MFTINLPCLLFRDTSLCTIANEEKLASTLCRRTQFNLLMLLQKHIPTLMSFEMKKYPSVKIMKLTTNELNCKSILTEYYITFCSGKRTIEAIYVNSTEKSSRLGSRCFFPWKLNRIYITLNLWRRSTQS